MWIRVSSYVICATPRSGSNFLCELLSSLGWAGKPEEYLWDPPNCLPESLAGRWPRIRARGTGSNGVFGIKLMWYQAERLERELPEVLGKRGQSLTRVLATTLDDPKYIYLTRRDRLRQAISLVRAMQTGQWRSMDGASGTLHYDAAAINRQVRFLEGDERHWEEFFERNALSPYRLTYEDLAATPKDTLISLLNFLGYDGSPPISLRSARHRRQADEITETWAHLYEREALR